jgi:hypothetical protein
MSFSESGISHSRRVVKWVLATQEEKKAYQKSWLNRIISFPIEKMATLWSTIQMIYHKNIY